MLGAWKQAQTDFTKRFDAWACQKKQTRPYLANFEPTVNFLIQKVTTFVFDEI